MERPRAPLQVLLVCKTLAPRASRAYHAATAPWALGAFSLERYVATLPDLATRVSISVRSYPSDAPDELILHEILAAAPDVVGFTCQPWNYADHVRLSRLVKRLMPGIDVWHGGPMVIRRDEYLARLGAGAVDVVVEGEGEESFAELLAHRVFGAPSLDAIAGIGWFDAQGAPHVTAPRLNPDVSRLPPVITEDNLPAMGAYVLYETSRGCPFRCSFCNWGSQKAKLRVRDRAVIERDLAAILARPEVTHLWITDAGLDISSEHILFLADCIRKYRRHPVHVSGYVFLLHADLSYVKKLVGAFDTLQLGLQTANENVLSEMGRKALSVDRFDRILDAVVPHFPDLRVDLIYGLPNIGIDELRRSVRFLLEKSIWLINLYRLVAIPGTELGDHREKYAVVAGDDFPFSVYSSEGCSVRDLFEMQQFKVNMDTLRAMFAGDSYRRAKAVGLDLVDFASSVHLLVPRFNFRTEYGLEMDRELDPDLVSAIAAAAAAYAKTDEQRAFFEQLLRDTYGDPAGRGSAASERVLEVRAPPPPDAAPAPSARARRLGAAFAADAGGFRLPLSAAEARAEWRDHLAGGASPDRLGVHVHVPFCTTICTYCDCATEALEDGAQVRRYLEFVEAELEFFDGVADGGFERLYVGGGTPNLLAPDDLDRLLGAVKRHHRFRPGAVLCLEGHPVHSTRTKLDVAAAHGINRVSFGVQSCDPRVLRRVNRGDQTPAHVERALADAMDAKIAEINLDFIHGLADEPGSSMFDAVTWAVGLGPSTVCLQLLNDSHFASPYTDDEHRRRVAVDFHALAARLCEWVAARAPAYEIDMRPDTVVIHRRDLCRDWRGHLEYYSARDRVRRATIGYGRHAQSTLFGRLVYQNQDRSGRFDPHAPLYAARRTTPALECAGDLVADLEDRKVSSLDELRAFYGDAVVGAVEPLLARLAAAGHLDMDERWVRDRALAPSAVSWLVRALAPAAPPPERAGPSIRVTGERGEWRIRLEPARQAQRYFGVARGVGVFYETGPGVEVDDARRTRIMRAVVRLCEELLARGVAVAALAAEIAPRLDARLAASGMRAKVDEATPKRHRLTVLAPG